MHAHDGLPQLVHKTDRKRQFGARLSVERGGMLIVSRCCVSSSGPGLMAHGRERERQDGTNYMGSAIAPK